MSQVRHAAAGPRGWVGRTSLFLALVVGLLLGTVASAQLADPGPDDRNLPGPPTCSPAGTYICTHPRDVFVRLDDRPPNVNDPLSTFIYRFDQNQGSPVTLLENDYIWNPNYPTEGLSVDKFERIVTVRRKDPVSTPLPLTPGKYMYYNLDQSDPGWKGPFTVPLGTTITPVGDGVDRIYVPQVIDVSPCAPSSPTHINQIHWCHANRRCPDWYKKPNDNKWAEDAWIVAHPAYRALGPASFPSGPNSGAVNIPGGGAVDYYAGAKMVVGFARWFLTRDFISSTGGAGYYAGTFSSPDQCQTPWVRWSYLNGGNTKWNTLIRSYKVDSVEEKKAMIAFAKNSDRVAAGMGAGAGDATQTLGNDITTRVSARTYWRLFGSCGDNCISGSDSIAGETTELNIPTRILFGSEGTNVTDQAAYTIVPNPGSVVVQRMTLSGGSWNYSSVGPERTEDTGFDSDPTDDPPGTYLATFGNATAPDSRDPCFGNDFIYMKNAHPRHFTVASRFWRSGGTTFHYLDDAEGNVAWEEHSFDLSTITCISPCDAACNGAFIPPATAPGGTIKVGGGMFAITADGAGNLYWLDRGFTPDNLPGETYPDNTAMLSDPNMVTPAGPFNSWPTKDNRAHFGGILGAPGNAHYMNQEDFTPPPDNMAYPPFVRKVYLRQNETYELFGFNYLPYRNQSDIDARLGGPYDAQIDRRGTLSNGGQILAYEAKAPQTSIPPPDDNIVNVNVLPSNWVSSSHSMVCATSATDAADIAALTTPTPLVCGAWVETLNPPNARPPNFLDIDTETYQVTRVRQCSGTVLNVRVGTVASPDSGPGTPSHPDYDDTSFDFTPCTTPVTMTHYVAWSEGTIEETEIEDHEYLFKTGVPSTYTWSTLGAGNPVESGAVSFKDFTLDMAAVNVTEPPPFAGSDTRVDMMVQGSGPTQLIPEDSTNIEIRLENGPYFGGQFTNAAFGTQNSNFLGDGDSGFPSEPSPKSEGDVDGDGMSSAFASSMVQSLFAYRYRIKTLSEPQRYAFHDGQPASPNPNNNGIIYRWPEDGSFRTPSSAEFNDRIEAPLLGPGGSGNYVFEDPGKYRIVMDIQGQFWVPPGGGLNFFSQPDDLTFLRFRGAYPAGSQIDQNGVSNPADVDAAFWNQPAGDSDRDSFDAGNYMRIYHDVEVGPAAPVDNNIYVRDIQVTARIDSFGEDVGGDEIAGDDTTTDMPDNVPDKVARIQANDGTSSVIGSIDDVRGFVATFELDWYRAEDFDYDEELGDDSIDLFGSVHQDAGAPDTDMAKYGGVGVLQHSNPPAACAAVSGDVALQSLESQGLLASKHTDYQDCQTHVALTPTRRDWQEIKYSWYVKAKDPASPSNWVPLPSTPDATEFGYLIAEGDLSELFDMDNSTSGGVMDGSDHRHQAFRDYIADGTSDLLAARGSGYPDNRTYDVTLPLYGRDPLDPNRLMPLEVAVPTLPVQDGLVFTVVIEYPKVRWVQGTGDNDANYVLEQVGGPNYGHYAVCGNYTSGSCPDGANPGGGSSAYDSIDIRDRTPPWLEGFEGTAGNSNSGGVVHAAGSQTEGDLTADLFLRLIDNAVYNDQVPGEPSEFKYTVGAEPRVGWANALWASPGNFGFGLNANGSPPPPFDISFLDVGGGGTFLRDNTANDFPGATPHNPQNHVYVSNDGNYTVATGGMSSVVPVEVTVNDPETFFSAKTPEASDRTVSSSPPADWILHRYPQSWGGVVTGRLENNVKGVWGVNEEQLPIPAFVTDGVADEVAITVQTTDGVSVAGDAENPANVDIVDLAAPNLMVEFLDQRSGQAVYFSAVGDWRHQYDGSMKTYSGGVSLENFRIQVSRDDRPIMVNQGQDRASSQEFGPYAQTGNGSGQFLDFRTDMGAWSKYTTLDDLGSPGQSAYNWLIEEDVLFRVRAIAVDNSTAPSAIKLGIRSLGASSHEFKRVPRNWTSGDPPTADLRRVIAGKAVIEGWHRYPREGTTDALEVIAMDEQGNTRIIQVGIQTFPNDTDFRVISDRVRKTN